MHGKRLNTREWRTKQKLEKDRHDSVLEMTKINPNYKPPPEYRPPLVRLHEKVWIPQDEHPEINFVGLIIGPRGNTLKTLERETGAKIIIRGKGSVKEGKLAIAHMNSLPGADEDLHAYVTALSEPPIKAACQKIRDIIDNALQIPDGQNELRQLQLRELALLNGTLRPEDLLSGNRCSNCGAPDHKSWECEEAENITGSTICMRCGGAGHIARDCKSDTEAIAGLDEEYSALMQELGEGPGGGGGGSGGQPMPGPGAGRGGFVRGRGGGPPRFGMMGRGGGRGFFDPPPPRYGKPNFEGGAEAVGSIRDKIAELSKGQRGDGDPTVVRINLAGPKPKPQPLMSIDPLVGGPPPPPPGWGWPPMPPPGMPPMPGMGMGGMGGMPMPPMPPPWAMPGMPQMPMPPSSDPGPMPVPAPVPPPPPAPEPQDNGGEAPMDFGSFLMPPAPPPPPETE